MYGLTNGFSLKSEWQRFFLELPDFSMYCLMVFISPNSSSDLLFSLSLFYGDFSKGTNFN